MRQNKIRESLRAGTPTVGTRVFGTSPGVVELVGKTGRYDYVEFVAEYGTFDLYDLDNICRAAELHDMGTMIKIDQSNQRFMGQRAVGAGFQAVLFTDCRSADDVRECVRIVRPDTLEDGGLYPAAGRRNTGQGESGGEAYLQSIRDIIVCVMIEKRGALDELEEILSIPGLDMVQWGGTDFSMNIGLPQQRSHPDVEAARLRVFETAVKMGVPPRAEVATAEHATPYLEMGVKHFSIGADMPYLYGSWKRDGEALRALLD